MNAAEFNSMVKDHGNMNGIKAFVDDTNSRLKIKDYLSISNEDVLSLINFARNKNLGKIITNCHREMLNYFKDCGFIVEGKIQGYFNGEDAFCASFFTDKKRELSIHKEKEDSLLLKCLGEKREPSGIREPGFTIRTAATEDIPQMVQLYSEVFETYPSPIFNSEYLESIMLHQVLFKVAVKDDKIVGIASADIDICNYNAEITDCVTNPEYRGKGFLTSLIQSLEHDLQKRNFSTLYSLSRATSPGINKSLCNLGYQYSGRLIKNCHICGSFEDMNIWVKSLRRDDLP